MNGNWKKWIVIAGIAATICLIVGVSYLLLAQKQNRIADITEYELSFERLPKAFDGMVVAQISDYHGDATCREQILHSLRQREPEIIAITGDLLDPDVESESLDFASELTKIAPTYFIAGNHEARMENYVEMEMRLRSSGVIVLRNEAKQIVCEGETITLVGADDEDMETEPDYEALCSAEGFVLLLSHRPEHFEEYAAAQPDLVLAGHAHGGQIRLPDGSRGLLAHEKRLLPRYTQGVHEMGNTTMVISRGIANTYFPPRLFNPPELVYVTLKCA